ncbi:MAG: DUF1203 domain-containing protein [Pseudomonadota bacterium]
MPFQIHALSPEPFQPFFTLEPEALKARGAQIRTVAEHPGAPCRVSLEDAAIGERVLLINHEHLTANSPYRATHAIYVREGAAEAQPAPDTVPDVIQRRLISVRGFDAESFIQAADVVDGTEVAATIEAMFADPAIAFIHLHNAKQGCFAARVTRA